MPQLREGRASSRGTDTPASKYPFQWLGILKDRSFETSASFDFYKVKSAKVIFISYPVVWPAEPVMPASQSLGFLLKAFSCSSSLSLTCLRFQPCNWLYLNLEAFFKVGHTYKTLRKGAKM